MTLKEWLHAKYQFFLLMIPNLSEIRLASSKTLAFLRAWHFLHRCLIHGDYLEFGVYQGNSFLLSDKCASKFFSSKDKCNPRFFAFDSFEGLPETNKHSDKTNIFFKGQYRSSDTLFEKNIASIQKRRAVHIVKGFYDKSLSNQTYLTHNLSKAAFINIDCDLFDSTLSALNFIVPLLQTGTILYFDDWFYSGGDMQLGEAGACAAWLQSNPNITLVDFGRVGIMGQMFIANVRKP